jgi:hypothetical protein
MRSKFFSSGARGRGRLRRLSVRTFQAVALAALLSAGVVFTLDRARNFPLQAAATIGSPGALVLAKKPTLSEIVELILSAPDPGSFSPFASASADKTTRVSEILRHYTRDPDKADRIASAIVAEGLRHRISPSLLVGVLLTENPWLDTRARSKVGARGLMQVMPFHSGKWGCPSRDLFNIESNICHGVRILAETLRKSHSLNGALLSYNGCVRGRNTPDCNTYSRHVLSLANQSAKVIDDGSFTPPKPSPSVIRQKLVPKWNIPLPRELLVNE